VWVMCGFGFVELLDMCVGLFVAVSWFVGYVEASWSRLPDSFGCVCWFAWIVLVSGLFGVVGFCVVFRGWGGGWVLWCGCGGIGGVLDVGGCFLWVFVFCCVVCFGVFVVFFVLLIDEVCAFCSVVV